MLNLKSYLNGVVSNSVLKYWAHINYEPSEDLILTILFNRKYYGIEERVGFLNEILSLLNNNDVIEKVKRYINDMTNIINNIPTKYNQDRILVLKIYYNDYYDDQSDDYYDLDINNLLKYAYACEGLASLESFHKVGNRNNLDDYYDSDDIVYRFNNGKLYEVQGYGESIDFDPFDSYYSVPHPFNKFDVVKYMNGGEPMIILTTKLEGDYEHDYGIELEKYFDNDVSIYAEKVFVDEKYVISHCHPNPLFLDFYDGSDKDIAEFNVIFLGLQALQGKGLDGYSAAILNKEYPISEENIKSKTCKLNNYEGREYLLD